MWTEQDIQILRTLTVKVRLLTLDQITAVTSHCSNRQILPAPDCLEKLTRARLLERYRINAHPILDVSSALFSWSPGSPDPNPAVLSDKAQNRWSKPAVSTVVYSASPLSANLFGSFSTRLPPASHWDHDLLLAQVYLHYLRTSPTVAKQWSGEDARPKAGRHIKDPDVFLYDDHGQILRVIESAGRYKPKQIHDFHQHCSKYQLSYELW